MDRVIELAEEEGVASRGDPTQAARASMNRRPNPKSKPKPKPKPKLKPNPNPNPSPSPTPSPTQAARASMKYGDGAQVAIGTKIELMPRVNTWFGSACEKVPSRYLVITPPRCSSRTCSAHAVHMQSYPPLLLTNE